MKLINTSNGATVAEIITNKSMSIDEALQLLGYTISQDGEVMTAAGETTGAWYEEIEMIY